MIRKAADYLYYISIDSKMKLRLCRIFCADQHRKSLVMKKVSLVVPCFNESEVLPVFYKEIIKEIDTINSGKNGTDDNKTVNQQEYTFEILFIDDGSKDATKEIIKSLAQSDERVIYLSFSRNFGKEAAIYAGLCNASGDFVCIMDADLQDPPALISEMLRLMETGEYDCVAPRRVTRKGEPPVRSWFAKLFYKLMNRFSDAEIMDGARDFRMMNRKMVNAIISMSEANRFSKGIFGWVGFRTYWIPYENVERAAGQTKWSFWKLFKYAVEGIISFSDAPLNFVSWFGILMTGISFLLLLFVIVRKLLLGDPVAGWASTICVIIFIGGIQLFCLGIISQYIANIYLETKARPHYIVSESNKDSLKKIG